MDYRQINGKCKSDAKPIPRVIETLEKLGGNQYFSSVDCISAYWQFPVTRKFDDVDTSERILSARTPSDAKRIGASVHGFKPKVWDKVREDVMLKLLRIKFDPGSDMATKLVATAGKSLAEAGQSVTFSIGMSLNNRDLFKTDKCTKNVLGKLLMKVREELS